MFRLQDQNYQDLFFQSTVTSYNLTLVSANTTRMNCTFGAQTPTKTYPYYYIAENINCTLGSGITTANITGNLSVTINATNGAIILPVTITVRRPAMLVHNVQFLINGGTYFHTAYPTSITSFTVRGEVLDEDTMSSLSSDNGMSGCGIYVWGDSMGSGAVTIPGAWYPATFGYSSSAPLGNRTWTVLTASGIANGSLDFLNATNDTQMYAYFACNGTKYYAPASYVGNNTNNFNGTLDNGFLVANRPSWVTVLSASCSLNPQLWAMAPGSSYAYDSLTYSFGKEGLISNSGMACRLVLPPDFSSAGISWSGDYWRNALMSRQGWVGETLPQMFPEYARSVPSSADAMSILGVSRGAPTFGAWTASGYPVAFPMGATNRRLMRVCYYSTSGAYFEGCSLIYVPIRTEISTELSTSIEDVRIKETTLNAGDDIHCEASFNDMNNLKARGRFSLNYPGGKYDFQETHDVSIYGDEYDYAITYVNGTNGERKALLFVPAFGGCLIPDYWIRANPNGTLAQYLNSTGGECQSTNYPVGAYRTDAAITCTFNLDTVDGRTLTKTSDPVSMHINRASSTDKFWSGITGFGNALLGGIAGWFFANPIYLVLIGGAVIILMPLIYLAFKYGVFGAKD